MDMEGSRFAFFQKSPQISMEKVKAGIFDGPQIRELTKDPIFDEALSEAELSAWQSLKSVVTNFLENHWNVEYEKKIEEFLPTQEFLPTFCGHTWTIFQRTVEIWVKSRMSTFKDIHIMEEHYQGWWDGNFLVDYCWCLKQGAVVAEHRRKSLKRPFIHV